MLGNVDALCDSAKVCVHAQSQMNPGGQSWTNNAETSSGLLVSKVSGIGTNLYGVGKQGEGRMVTNLHLFVS